MDSIIDFKSLLKALDYFSFDWPRQRFFKPSEFFLSPTADRLCIDNFPVDSSVYKNLGDIVYYVLVPVRIRLNQPIIITSGYRSPKLNKAVNGAERSYHIFGRAVDIYSSNLDALEKAIKVVNNSNLEFHKPVLKEFIRHKTYIHIAL